MKDVLLGGEYQVIWRQIVGDRATGGGRTVDRTQFYGDIPSDSKYVSPPLWLSWNVEILPIPCLFSGDSYDPPMRCHKGKIHCKPRETGNSVVSMQQMIRHHLLYCPVLSAGEISTTAIGPYSPFYGSKLRPTFLTVSSVQTGRHATESQGLALFILKWTPSRTSPPSFSPPLLPPGT